MIGPVHFHARYTVPAALELLPRTFDALGARAMLLAIALQESDCCHRRQRGGPARGYWMFELGGGVMGVLTHPTTRRFARSVLEQLRYGAAADAETCHEALEHNDVLACAFARLLLFTVPSLLPRQDQVDEAWKQYLEAWRPGRPRPIDWPANYHLAWSVVLEE